MMSVFHNFLKLWFSSVTFSRLGIGPGTDDEKNTEEEVVIHFFIIAEC